MEVAFTAVWAAIRAGLRCVASAGAETWKLIPSEWHAAAVLLAAAGSLATLLFGSLKLWRESRGLELSLHPGRYIGSIPPIDRFEVYPFNLTIINRASTPNSLVNVRFFVDGSERHCTVASPVGLIGRPIESSESLVALVVVRAEWIVSESFREVRFQVQQVRGGTRTFRIKAEKLVSTY